MARVRRLGATRRASVSPTAWAWFTGALLDDAGNPVLTRAGAVERFNPFELLDYLYPDARGRESAVEPLRPSVQWMAAREAVLEFWKRRGEPMPAPILRSVAAFLTSEERAALETGS